jgi:hypothetical protein
MPHYLPFVVQTACKVRWYPQLSLFLLCGSSWPVTLWRHSLMKPIRNTATECVCTLPHSSFRSRASSDVNMANSSVCTENMELTAEIVAREYKANCSLEELHINAWLRSYDIEHLLETQIFGGEIVWQKNKTVSSNNLQILRGMQHVKAINSIVKRNTYKVFFGTDWLILTPRRLMREWMYNPHFLELGISWGWFVSFTVRPLNPRRKSPQLPIDLKPRWSSSRPGWQFRIQTPPPPVAIPTAQSRLLLIP